MEGDEVDVEPAEVEGFDSDFESDVATDGESDLPPPDSEGEEEDPDEDEDEDEDEPPLPVSARLSFR